MNGLAQDAKRHSTSSVAPTYRIQYWRDLVCNTFVELSCESVKTSNFTGDINSFLLGNNKFSFVKSIGQHVVRDRARIAKSSADCFLLSLQLEGRGLLVQDGRCAHLQKGDLALYDVTRPYDFHFENPFEQLVIQLPRDVIRGRLFDVENLTAISVAGKEGIGRLAFLLFTEIANQTNNFDQNDLESAQITALDFLATALSKQVGSKAKILSENNELVIRRATDFIEHSLGNEMLSVQMIAQAVGISTRYLRKLFQGKEYSVSEWIWLRRLENAKVDLCDPLKTHHSITSIAYNWGFKNPAHFSRAFKQKFGCSPRDVRPNSVTKIPAFI